jgi:cellulose synthase (UDP-forming)
MLPILFQSVFFLVVLCYAAYVLLELRMVALSGKREKIRLEGMDATEAPFSPEACPTVSVLLPIYNENEVVRRLLDAVCALDYPADKLEILVLDDSTDATVGMLQALVDAHGSRGVTIRLLRRESRIGYKAGNLIHGMEHATGDFLAVFDADCLPPRDFLLKTMHCFKDPAIGFLQTGIGYTNQDASFLTMFQAMEAGHQQFVTVGLCSGGLMASLSGNSCVWRRACIEDIGGISTETITEDVDLGYRAQLRAWKYVFLRNLASATELPATISPFRVQRERWARGLIHNAARHVRAMFAAPMPASARMHALSMMFSSLLLASFYLLVLLALPLTFMTESLGSFFNLSCTLFLLTALAWACSNFTGSRRGASRNRPEPLMKIVARTYAYVAMFFPMSLYYFCAAVRVAAGLKGEFNRTPKGKSAARAKHPPINALLFSLELLSLAYALATLACAVYMHNYWVCLFSGIVCSGFGLAAFLSWQERRARQS